MTADLGTRCGAAYVLADELLPDGGGARNLEGGSCLPGEVDAFARSRERFEGIVEWLDGEQADGLEHAELEDRLQVEGRELLRVLFQDRMELRARREARVGEVVSCAGAAHGAVESGHDRRLSTIFGQVSLKRLAYRRRGEQNLYVADGLLNLPEERPSHGVCRLAAVESSKGSVDEATAAIRAVERETGRHLPIAAVTANALKSDRDACLAAGMDGYLSKPIQVEVLFAKIDSVLS